MTLEELKEKIKALEQMRRSLNELAEVVESLYDMKRQPNPDKVSGNIAASVYVEIPADVAYGLVVERYNDVTDKFNGLASECGVELRKYIEKDVQR